MPVVRQERSADDAARCRSRGPQKYSTIVDGDARNFSFADGLHLLVELSGRIVTLELQTGQFLASSSQPALPPRIARPGEVQGRLEETAADCVREHPYSTGYFTSAVSADGRLIAYTTEANQIVIADLNNGDCAGRVLDAHTHNVLAIAWGPTGRYLASAGAIADGDNSHGVALWDREQISSFAHIIYELKNLDPKFALSADGSSWICGSCDDRIVWDGRPVDLPAGVDAGHASAATMDADGKEAAVAVPGKIIAIRRSAASFNVELRESPSAPVHAMAYVNGALYAEDEKLSAWNVSGRGAVKTATTAPFGSTSCYDDSPAGPYLTSEVFDHAGVARLTLTDLNSGVVKEFPLPADADTCAALTFSPEAMIAVRTSANYTPFLAVPMYSGSPVRRISNPLRQSAGLPTVLRSAHLSRDGRRLVASSDNSGLAVFNLAADRLIGAIDLSEVRHVALAASGKVALVEGAGRILWVDLDPASWQRKAQQLVSQ